MEIVSHEVSALKSRKLPYEEIVIYPIGDIQYGSSACDFDRFKQHIAETSKNPNAYYVGLGDFVDMASPSNRGRIMAANDLGEHYDVVQEALHAAAKRCLDDIKSVLEPTQGRWLGLVEGHHYWQFPSGATTDTELCEYLGAPYLGTSGIVQLKFSPPRLNDNSIQSHVGHARVSIFCHHGRGGGKLTSSPLNILESIAASFEGVDVFLMGHQHKITSGKKQIIKPVWGSKGGRNKLEHRDIILACTGGYLKGYMAGNMVNGRPGGTYVERGLMSPVSLGGIAIRIKPYIANGNCFTEIKVES